MARYIGEILLNIDKEHISDAEDWIKKAIDVAKESGMRWSLASNNAIYAELFNRKGDQSKVKKNSAEL